MIDPQTIIQHAAAFFISTPAEVKGQKRHAHIVRARHVAMYLVRSHSKFSLQETGRLFGDRDHTTVLHAIRRVNREVSKLTEFGYQIDLCESSLLRTVG